MIKKNACKKYTFLLLIKNLKKSVKKNLPRFGERTRTADTAYSPTNDFCFKFYLGKNKNFSRKKNLQVQF